jgi:hypothetical protein
MRKSSFIWTSGVELGCLMTENIPQRARLVNNLVRQEPPAHSLSMINTLAAGRLY